LKKRTVSITRDLLRGHETIASLAEKHAVSERTIRNDLAEINDFLKSRGLSETAIGKAGRVVAGDDFREVALHLDKKDFQTYRLSKEERKLLTSLLLLTAPGHVTLSTMAEKLCVSRQTVINDLDGVKNYLRSNGVRVISHPNKGMRIEARESDARKLILKIAAARGAEITSFDSGVFADADPGERETILKIMRGEEKFRELRLTDESLSYVSLYLNVMVGRIANGFPMEPRPPVAGHKAALARDIVLALSRHRGFVPNDDEERFLAEILETCKYAGGKTQNKDALKIQLLTSKFIENVSKALKIDLLEDYDFHGHLCAHVSSVASNKNSFMPKIPEAQDILNKNKEVHEAVKANVGVFGDFINPDALDMELTYITIHVCAAMERAKQNVAPLRVALVCHGGICTSKLLHAKLRKYSTYDVRAVIFEHEAKNLKKEDIDLIITTVPILDAEAESVLVSPFLSDEDFQKISEKADSLRIKKKIAVKKRRSLIGGKEIIQKITPLVTKYLPRDGRDLLSDINLVLEEMLGVKDNKHSLSPKLSDLLSPEFIRLDVRCEDWEDTVRKSGQMLLDKNRVESRYISAMIDNIRENGPYVVISKGFALPHAAISEGALQVGMALIRLTEGVSYDETSDEPVDLVCSFSAIDEETHMRAFFNLVNILRLDDFKDELRKVKTSEEAHALIRDYEESMEG
jgi:transcriptional antiterminator/mannitol/fructose-specific phosphotransferase system IIA component (Ntr-type)